MPRVTTSTIQNQTLLILNHFSSVKLGKCFRALTSAPFSGLFFRIFIMPIRIGLTGGIASGKTSAQRFFEKLGVKAIDHDAIARKVVEPGTSGLQQLVELCGSDILTPQNTLDRQKLKDIIFQNATLKTKVEHIIHPLVFQASEDIINNNSSEPYILIVSPLLIESGSAATMNKLIVVDLPPEMQKTRLLARDGMTETLAMSIINSQATQDQRQQAADFILDNSQGLEELKSQVVGVHKAILKAGT